MAALSGLRLDENFLSAPVTAKVVAVQPQSTSWPGEGSDRFLSIWTSGHCVQRLAAHQGRHWPGSPGTTAGARSAQERSCQSNSTQHPCYFLRSMTCVNYSRTKGLEELRGSVLARRLWCDGGLDV